MPVKFAYLKYPPKTFGTDICAQRYLKKNTWKKYFIKGFWLFSGLNGTFDDEEDGEDEEDDPDALADPLYRYVHI